VFASSTSTLIYVAIIKMVNADVNGCSPMQQDNTHSRLRNQDDHINGG
jgi:hypothetical protein